MQSKITFTLLLMLSFTIFHDTFITHFEKHEQTNITHYLNQETSSEACIEYTEIHNMCHFMAIIDTFTNTPIFIVQKESIPHLLIDHTPPLQKTSHKPPIV
ncbi:MAG: hypothetical protein U9O64_10395 [Campylobacterota bacterium]|nr:hypothetical protein [Campylobacterota bacterium]